GAGPTGAAGRGSAAASNRRRDCAAAGRKPPGPRAKRADRRAAARAPPRKPCARYLRRGTADRPRPPRRRRQITRPRAAARRAARSSLRCASWLPRRLQIIGGEVVGDLAAHRFAHFERITEVDAAPDAYLLVLFHHLPDDGEATLQTRVAGVGRRKAR